MQKKTKVAQLPDQTLFELEPVSKPVGRFVGPSKKVVLAQQFVTDLSMEQRGLNGVYATGQFGEWIVENRGNKTYKNEKVTTA